MSELVNHIRSRRLNVGLWQGLCLLLFFGIIADHYLTVWTVTQPLRFVAMDGSGTFWISRLGTFETADEFRVDAARTAAEAMFNRNPNGFDNPKQVERAFNGVCYNRLKEQASRDADEFRLSQIHQEVEMGRVNQIALDSDTARMSVECQVIRSRLFGVVEKRVITDARRCTLLVKLAVNQDMAHSGKFPLEVVDYEVRWL
jgi:hypothetical protein